MLAACELVRKLGGNLIGCQLVIELTDLKGVERVTKVFNGMPFKVLMQY